MKSKVTICGGGIAGLSCAITLLKVGYDVTVIDEFQSGTTFEQSDVSDDVNVFVLGESDKLLIESLLETTFVSASKVTCLSNKGSYVIPCDRFRIARKGYTRNSFNSRLHSVAAQLGAKFQSQPAVIPDTGSDQEVVLAMGNGASQFDYCLYGWRFNVECRIPDKSVLFDVCSITDSYCYAARLGSSVTIVLLSKRDLEDRVVADYYRNRLRSVIDGSIEFTCTPFVYPMPTRLRDPYQRNMIGTMRGINDSLFYFGFSDSIVDGINYGLWRAFEDYNAGSFLRNNFRKHALIEIANFLKNVFHYFGKKELFAEMILKNRLLTDCFIGLTSTSFSEDLAESIGRITTGWRHRSDAKTTAPLSGRIRPSTGGGFTAIDSPFDSAQGDTVKS